ncbi:MAG: hypothetical protein CMJ00_03485 [Pelagibacteraceae bacterium]|jgi:hypothetical protein|nr:hypothetical protein [Pelagibacteraceae bacterium]|tara:strand:+ start:1319 stop:1741 length:423 start_codon:yes stop_codon:yes gene_type:complete
MIKYNLKCHKEHEFESWFSSSEEFEKLTKKKLLECIYCLSKKIDKSIMAPMVTNSKSKNNKFEIVSKNLKNQKNELVKLRKYIEKNFDYVGKDFSKRVREIYYDKDNKKAIYGTTTSDERKELSEEGIDLLSIPWVNKDN